jgi:hypothetical protein
VLEHRWSEGGLWRLLPAPQIDLRLHIRVGEDYQVRAIRSEGAKGLVIWLPHAAGTATGSEIMARLAAARGFAVAALLPPPDLPLPGAPVEEWVALVEERIRSARAAVDLYASDDAGCTVLMGVSVGGIAALRVAELEERIDVAVGMLAGGGETGLTEAARAYGAAVPSSPEARLSLRLGAVDPSQHAEALQGREVLLVRALFDDVIPDAAFLSLRSAIGDPPVHNYPTGHESFPYALPLAIERALEWAAAACTRTPQIP